MRSAQYSVFLWLSLTIGADSLARADELVEGATASYNRLSLRPTGLDLGFATSGKYGGATEFQHVGPYLRLSYRFHFFFAYTTVGVSRVSLEFRRRSLAIERAALSTTALAAGQGIGFDVELGRHRLAFFTEGERTLWTSALFIDELRFTKAELAAVGEEMGRQSSPHYRWWLVRAGSLWSVQIGRVAPYVSAGYLWFNARLDAGLRDDLKAALTAAGVDANDLSERIVARDTPAGSVGVTMSITTRWVFTGGAAFAPTDMDFDDWVLATNLAIGHRF